MYTMKRDDWLNQQLGKNDSQKIKRNEKVPFQGAGKKSGFLLALATESIFHDIFPF